MSSTSTNKPDQKSKGEHGREKKREPAGFKKSPNNLRLLMLLQKALKAAG